MNVLSVMLFGLLPIFLGNTVYWSGGYINIFFHFLLRIVGMINIFCFFLFPYFHVGNFLSVLKVIFCYTAFYQIGLLLMEYVLFLFPEYSL